MQDIFSRSNELLKGVIYEKIEKYPTFLHIKSVFKDAWYNFIVPEVAVNNFDWTKAEKIVSFEKKKSVDVSYYIKEGLLKEYKPSLKKKGLKEFGDDTYMVLQMKNKFKDVSGEFDEVNEENFDKYVSMAVECFPDWPGEENYCKYFFQLAKGNKDKDKLFSNLLLKENGEYVSFASVYASKKLNLAYFHNDGTPVKFRRAGYHTKLLKKRCNVVFAMGIRNIYALLEEGSSSFYSYVKPGFKPDAKFFLFTK